MKKNLAPGKFLKKIRQSKKESQALVAKRGNTNQPHIGMFERGLRSVSRNNVERIVRAYQLSYGEEVHLQRLAGFEADGIEVVPRELKALNELILLPKEIRQRIIRAAIAYDSASDQNGKSE